MNLLTLTIYDSGIWRTSTCSPRSYAGFLQSLPGSRTYTCCLFCTVSQTFCEALFPRSMRSSRRHKTPPPWPRWLVQGWAGELGINQSLAWCFCYLLLKTKLSWNLMALSDNHFTLPQGSVAGIAVSWRLAWAGPSGTLTEPSRLTHAGYWCWVAAEDSDGVVDWSILLLLPHGLSMWLGLFRACQLGSKKEHSK